MDVSQAINVISFVGGVIVAVACTLIAISKWKTTVDSDIRGNRKSIEANMESINAVAEQIRCFERKTNQQHQEFMAEMRAEFAKIWDKLSDIDRRVAHIEGKLEIGD